MVSGPPSAGVAVADNPNRLNPPLIAVCAAAACDVFSTNTNPEFPIPGCIGLRRSGVNAPDVNPTFPLELKSDRVRLLRVIGPESGWSALNTKPIWDALVTVKV